jgi:hypothetical protein
MTIYRAFAVGLLACGLAPCGVIYSTYGPGHSRDQGNAWGLGTIPNSVDPDEGEMAAPFTPGAAYTLDSLILSLSWNFGPKDLTVYLASGDSAPSTVLETFNLTNVAAGQHLETLNSLTHPALASGTKYWVVLTMPDLVQTWAGWGMNDQGLTGSTLVRNRSYLDWTESPDVTLPAFEVNASAANTPNPDPPGGPSTDTPEPGTTALVGLGSLAIVFRLRRSK